MSSLIFHNGPILTQNPKQPNASAVAILNGIIRSTSGLKEARWAVGKEDKSINLKDRTLLPAFHDPHIHIWKVGHLLTSMLDLRGTNSMDELQEKIAVFANQHPNQPWILARGFNEANFPDGRMPSRKDLDKVLSDRPVQIIRTCAHIAVLNSRALEICNIHRDTPSPTGGEIRIDADGNPTGILTETALGIPQRHIPQPSAADYRSMILAAQNALIQKGIACATDPAVHPELLEVYRQMEAAGELKIRVNAIPIMVPDGATESLPLPELYDSDFLKINTVKFFADGGLSGKTAALKHGYIDKSAKSGVLRLDIDFFKKCAAKAKKAGFRLATHAIGDQAIEQVLEVYTSVGGQKGHRIEHLGLPELSHLLRMRDMGIYCVSQPIFLWELGRNFRQSLPGYYLENVYPYRSILDAGIPLAFSSDAPVVRNFNPFMGIQNAVERIDANGVEIAPYQKITVEAALSAYTNIAAKASGFEKISGSIEAGKMADFIIVDKNPLEVAPSELSQIRVEELWIGGKRV